MATELDLTPGAIFAQDFRVIRPLAEGGMGVVYLVEQVSTGRERALKLMLPSLVQEGKNRERFELEAKVGARIKSEHVVEVVSAGVDAATAAPWLVMELLEGELLGALVKRRKHLPPGEVLEIFRQLCHGLGAAHAVDLVHRDLKPSNIVLAQSRRQGASFIVKLLDFGIAKYAQKAEIAAAATQAVGSPLWMAPEQADPRSRIVPASDVWALGLLAFYMLTGKLYWKSPNSGNVQISALLREMLFEPLEPASVRATMFQRGGTVPAGFDAWFARCVDRDQTARFPDAHAALRALVPVLEPAAVATPVDTLSATALDVLGKTAPADALSPEARFAATQIAPALAPTLPAPASPFAPPATPFVRPADPHVESTMAWNAAAPTLPDATGSRVHLTANAFAGFTRESAMPRPAPRGRARHALVYGAVALSVLGVGAYFARSAPSAAAARNIARAQPRAVSVPAPSAAMARVTPATTTPREAVAPAAHATLAIATPTPRTAVTDLASGAERACAVIADGTVRCWSRGLDTPRGESAVSEAPRPQTVAELRDVAEIRVGREHSCARLTDGTVRCWGRNEHGQLGDGTTTDRTTPTPVRGLEHVAQLAIGESHTCARLQNGGAQCWGANDHGQLGDGTTTDRPVPDRVRAIRGLTQLAAWGDRTCAVTSGSVRCWGRSTSSAQVDHVRPVQVRGLSEVSHLAMGGDARTDGHVCARTSDGALVCWGANASGQLGDGTLTSRALPAPVAGLRGVVAFALGARHTCATLADGAVRCWGDNRAGQLGDGTLADRVTPVEARGLQRVAQLALGASYSCARDGANAVRCWGAGESGAPDNDTARSEVAW